MGSYPGRSVLIELPEFEEQRTKTSNWDPHQYSTGLRLSTNLTVNLRLFRSHQTPYSCLYLDYYSYPTRPVRPIINAEKALELRGRKVTDKPPRHDAPFVLVWLRNALRGVDNPTIDAAVALANKLGQPVVVLQDVGSSPYPSARLHTFALQAAPGLARDLEARGIRYALHVTSAGQVPLAFRLAKGAGAVFSDDLPTARTVLGQLAQTTNVPVTAVDSACLVPLATFSDVIPTPSAFLRAHRQTRELHERLDLTQAPTLPPYEGDLGNNAHPDNPEAWQALIRDGKADLSLPPVSLSGSREAALVQLRRTLDEVLPEYDARRTNPADPQSCSRLSPYLHFGTIGVRELVRGVHEADVPTRARYKFLDELLKWREFFYHQADKREDPASYAHVASWARESLAEHAQDERPELYSQAELLNGDTADETWNAAQKAYLCDGWMHNNLRMYWAAQLLKWLPTPEEAYKTACVLNDRLSLDGRDPSTYGNIQYMFGGGKRGYRELDIYGWVPPRSDRALRNRPGVPAWLKKAAQRQGPVLEPWTEFS